MLKSIGILSSVVLLTACQTTVSGGSNTHQLSPKQAPQVIMKDVRPRGGTQASGSKWNNDMPTTPWSYNVTNVVPARSGDLSQRFELRNGDCKVHPRNATWGHDPNWGCYNQRERAEIWGKEWRPGRDQWVGFSLMIDDSWEKSQKNHCTGVFQIKQMEDNVKQANLGKKNGDYSTGHYIGGHAVMHGQICGDKFGVAIKWTGFEDSKFNGWEKTENIFFGNINDIKGKWNDIQMRWDTRDYRNGNSKLELYFGGQKKAEWNNITSKFFPDTYLFKYGPYRGYMDQWGVKSGTQTIYFDEIRFGSSLGAVNPQGKNSID